MNDLIIIEPQNALTLFTTQNGLDPILSKLKDEVDNFIPDVTTKKGRDEIASFAYSFAKSKTYLDGVGKKLVDDLKKQPKLIDAERSRVWDFIEGLQAIARKPLTDWEEREKNRIATIKSWIDIFDGYLDNKFIDTSESIKDSINHLKSIEIDDEFEEFKQEAEYKRTNTLLKLNELLPVVLKKEHDAIELQRLRDAEQARLKSESEEKLRIEGEERSRKQAEQKAQIERDAAIAKENELKEAAINAEREKQAAIDKAKQDAIDAAIKAEHDKKAAIELERKRIADEAEAEQLAIEKREANKRHVAKINNLAVAAFVKDGFSDDQSKKIVTLIAKKLVPSVSISY